MRILIFGDSIAQGYFDNRGGWVGRVANECQTKALNDQGVEWLEVFNLGVSGDTVEDVLRRIKDETAARTRENDEVMIIVAVGINDSVLIDHKVSIDEYKFQELYTKLIDTVTKISDISLFVGLTAVDEKLTSPLEHSGSGKQYLNNRINLFEDCIKQACNQKNARFAAVHDMFYGQIDGKGALLADGLHPNNAGHSLLYEILYPEIQQTLKKLNRQL